MESTNRKRKRNSTRRSINPLSDARRVYAKQTNDDEIQPKDGNTDLKRELINNNNNDDDGFNIGKITASTDRSVILTKADLKARELWHKKSGTGYDFFIQYYAAQPVGVVANEDEMMDTGREEVPKSSVENTAKGLGNMGRGQSRAAKKRRKKKNNNINTIPGGEDNNGAKVEKISIVCSSKNESQTTSKELDQLRSISPKLQLAMERHQKCQHLRIFLGTISEELPLTFRIRQHLNTAENGLKSMRELKEKLSKNFSHLVQPVQYDPSQSIYQAVPGTNLTKVTLGKVSPDLKSLILLGTSTELVARQELGSMLPVIALSGGNYMKYGSKVLDMCSSPGSKTLQALEIITSHAKDSNNGILKQKKLGRIVANDIHPLRIESLKDAILRSGLSTTLTDRIVYTNHDASKFPTPKSGKLFDCIIADVPCSGDGTIRKDPRILSGWMPSIGNSLHTVQKKILKRALRLVKVGGVVAYSTCSLNPIEDEAVVASVLSWANDDYSHPSEDVSNTLKVELLEWPSQVLPNLKRSKGVQSWCVASYIEENEHQQNDQGLDDISKLQWYKSFDEATLDKVPHAVQSMWPPHREHADYMNLDRCVRLKPQDNNTGGFFIALLKRVS